MKKYTKLKPIKKLSNNVLISQEDFNDIRVNLVNAFDNDDAIGRELSKILEKIETLSNKVVKLNEDLVKVANTINILLEEK